MQSNVPLKAAQGLDTQDLLNHIAWTDVIKPKLDEAKLLLTKQLVDATLNPQQPNSQTREQIAGRLWGIDYIITSFEKVLREGARAKELLAEQNLFLQ